VAHTIVSSLLSLLVWQELVNVLKRLWHYISYPVPIGNFEVSAVRLVTGILIFALALFLSKSLGSLIERRIAKRRHIDPGLRYTIARLVSLVVMTVGVLAALRQGFGIDLTSIAVVFTALSVGIGFGLQYIAADIASGFILLFERPIRVGDRITIGDDEGDVQSINLRTTIVNTNDRIAIIIPNSKLVSQRVINWSYGDPRARISIPVGVATDSDIDLVTATLLEAAQDVDRVLTDPPPNIQFLKFGDFSLDFRLLVWTRQPSRHPQIRSDINHRIARLFRERGIVIPHPVQELRFRSDDPRLKDPPLDDNEHEKLRDEG
jgi:potassium-dependent mechanosensitive channel